jgi:hypothetical protein
LLVTLERFLAAQVPRAEQPAFRQRLGWPRQLTDPNAEG